MTTKIVIDAGHGFNTAGKRSPEGEREWSFNNKVALACIARLGEYSGNVVLRTDDPTGRTDIPLTVRTNNANMWGADVLVSIHHNAYQSKWGNHGGVETFTQQGSQKASVDIARIIQPLIVKAMGLRDRGHKISNLHMTRASRMPAILTEGGFMDSLTDIGALRSDAKLRAQGIAIADGLAQYFKLRLKAVAPLPPPVAVNPPIVKEVDELAQRLPKTQQDDIKALLQRAYDGKLFNVDHTSKVATMTRGEALDLLISYVSRSK